MRIGIAVGTRASFECKWNSDLPPTDASSVKKLLSFSYAHSRWQDSFSLFVYVCMQQVHRTRARESERSKKEKKNGLVGWRSRNLNFFDWIVWPLGRAKKEKEWSDSFSFVVFFLIVAIAWLMDLIECVYTRHFLCHIELKKKKRKKNEGSIVKETNKHIADGLISWMSTICN